MKEHPDQPAGAEKDRKFVTALARGLDVLRAFEPRDNLLGNQEIARRTGLPKPTVTRLTYTLTKLGYLSYNKELERYQLGMGVLALGYATLANFGIRQIARPYMQDLAEEVNALGSGRIYATLLVSLVAFTVLYVMILVERYSLRRSETALDELHRSVP